MVKVCRPVIYLFLQILILLTTTTYISNGLTNPNVLIIFIDDLYYTQDLSVHSAPQGVLLKNNYEVSYLDIQTPNIQNFLSDGSIIFPRTYTGGPKCSPSRFTLLTGRYPSRCEYSVKRTVSEKNPEYGTYVCVPLTAITSNDSVYNMPNILKNYANIPNTTYKTAMFGKWHLMADNNLNCDLLDEKADAGIYENCILEVKTHGFDFVDAWYAGNIDASNEDFSHNPEWMVHNAQQFITETINNDENFFVYFSTTLAHGPSVMTALRNFTLRNSPRGFLEGRDVPLNTGMKTRTEMLEDVKEYMGQHPELEDDIDEVAGIMWTDDTIGALISYLQNLNIYDNTLIAILNDHGMIAKGTLYEHGSRVMQFIRYPPIYSPTDSGSLVLPNDFIVSSADLSATIYDIIGIDIQQLTNNEYIIDGKSWLSNVKNNIGNNIQNNECCHERYIDVKNSHSIITEKYQYIYRATDDTDRLARLYVNAHDTEQIYNLKTEASEQHNQINNSSMLDVICDFKLKMIEYISNVACPEGYVCTVPDTEGYCPNVTPTTTEPTVKTTSPAPTYRPPTTKPTPYPSNNPTICGKPRNSGPGRLIQCENDDFCCDGYECKLDRKKCVAIKIYSLIQYIDFEHIDWIDYFIVFMVIVNICMMIYTFYHCCGRRIISYEKVVQIYESEVDESNV